MHHLTRLILAALILGLSPVSQAEPNDWVQINLEGPIETQLPDGSMRTLHPSCSGGPVMTTAGPVPANTEFYFFVQKGNSTKLLFGLDGGGACWDAATCIGSPLIGQSTYTVASDETPEGLASAGGFFDGSNPENPFQNYTKIFVPYCSADVHWGSTDTWYVLDVAPGVQLPWLIHHRGMDNFLAVLDWLQKSGGEQFQIDFGRARDVTVSGASAGAYGANVAFAYVAELAPRANLNLISDAGVGVLTADFYKTAIFDPANPGAANWGVQGNLPSWVPGFADLLAQGAAYPTGFVPSVFAALAAYKPDAHLASLTTNLDLVQIFFYGLMKGVVPPDTATAAEWYFTMKALTAASASLPNYRFFIDAGTFHTFIGDNSAVYDVRVHGISLADWVRAMIKPGDRVWDNLDAGPPF
jgi:hypothetical protein